MLLPTVQFQHVPLHTDAKNPSNAAQKADLIGVDEVETMAKLTMKEPIMGKTVSMTGILEGTPSTIPSMESCNNKSCSSSCACFPYVIWRRRQHLSHLKRNEKMQVLLEHMGGSGGVGWVGWSSWATQRFAQGS